jgi:N-acetyl-gamma-glutamyl-phosphate reductase
MNFCLNRLLCGVYYAFMMHKYATSSAEKIPVGIVGITGYAGLELARLLRHHPGAALRVGFSTQTGASLTDFVPGRWARTVPVVPADEVVKWAPQLKAVFLATPPETSARLAPLILEQGTHVVDLSAAFRLKGESPAQALALYKEWYGFTHPAPDLLPRAEYGLCPWIGGEKAGPTDVRLVANPGCYATAVLMAVLPLLKRGLVRPDSLVIDAKSGASGAGRKAEERLLFTEVDGECLPYRVGRHQHLPEIRLWAAAFTGVAIDPFFSTHLLPVRRGILCSVYGELKAGVTAADLGAAYALDYSDYGLVEWGALGEEGARADAAALSLKRIAGSSLTRLRYQVQGRQLYLFSLIDNLVKGAAGQALENLNRLQGWPEATGLEEGEGIL